MERYRPRFGRGAAAAAISVFLVAGGAFAANAVFDPLSPAADRDRSLATDDQVALATGSPDPSPAPRETPRPTRSPAQGPSLASAISAGRAIDVALAAVPGGAVVEVSLDKENGRTLWEIVVRSPNGSGVEIYIDAATGTIVDREPHRVPDEARASAPAISALRAITIALAAVPGSSVVEVDLDTERGRVVWEVLVRAPGVELYIDAATGEILKQEADESDDRDETETPAPRETPRPTRSPAQG
ncbi:MAG TPA: PepSY domain-containing protein, partial [Patescibacteria group bacterium]|nr:PepSY domain-containing protein [Patescibacteria group bacterium]